VKGYRRQQWAAGQWKSLEWTQGIQFAAVLEAEADASTTGSKSREDWNLLEACGSVRSWHPELYKLRASSAKASNPTNFLTLPHSRAAYCCAPLSFTLKQSHHRIGLSIISLGKLHFEFYVFALFSLHSAAATEALPPATPLNLTDSARAHRPLSSILST